MAHSADKLLVLIKHSTVRTAVALAVCPGLAISSSSLQLPVLLQSGKDVFQDLDAYLFYGMSIQADVRVYLTELWKEHVNTTVAAQITK